MPDLDIELKRLAAAMVNEAPDAPAFDAVTTPTTTIQSQRVHRPVRAAALAGGLVLLLGVAIVVAVLASPNDSTHQPAGTGPTPGAEEVFTNSEFVPTLDCRGRTVGYVKGPANPTPDDGDGVDEVYRNPDGSGGVVGYAVDFGYVDKATYDDPGFNLETARASCMAEAAASK
jgi:hypothetical protein